jgi:transposase
MMREKQFTLSRSQRDRMWRRFTQSDNRRVAERLHAILLLDDGQNAQSVCSILQSHPNTLKRWVKPFVTGGEEALTTLNYAGGDGNLTVAQQQQLVRWLDAEVRSTAEAVAWVEEQFGVSYTDSGMVKLLTRRDYRFKQPDVLPSKADPEKQAEWVETYRQKRGS